MPHSQRRYISEFDTSIMIQMFRKVGENDDLFYWYRFNCFAESKFVREYNILVFFNFWNVNTKQRPEKVAARYFWPFSQITAIFGHFGKSPLFLAISQNYRYFFPIFTYFFETFHCFVTFMGLIFYLGEVRGGAKELPPQP